MKTLYLPILVMLSLFCSSNKTESRQDFFNKELFDKAEVVLRCIRIGEPGMADKYRWDKVKILKMYKNASNYAFSGELSIASLSWKKGIPEKECTVYLERYNADSNVLWKLLRGKAETGVSNIAD